MAEKKAKNLLDFFGVGNKSSSSSKNEMKESNQNDMDASSDQNKRKHSSDENSPNENVPPKKYPRGFNRDWLGGRPWLVVDAKNGSMLCDWCMITHKNRMPGGRGINWITTGCTRFQLSM